MNKGTKEGTEEEIKFVKMLNKKEDLLYWNTLGLNHSNHYAIKVIYMQEGKVNNQKIFPKADVYCVKGNIPLNYLKEKCYFLNEDDVKRFKLEKINYTGISIKRPDSRKYQIMKMGPSTFEKIFKSNILAAGASIYCDNPKNFLKNGAVLKGWNVTEEDFLNYFSKELNSKLESLSKLCQQNLKKIKKISNDKIKNIIEKDEFIREFLFFGKNNFKEPYTATWIYDKGELKRNSPIPFSITTGSGRTKGIYTIVLKPT